MGNFKKWLIVLLILVLVTPAFVGIYALGSSQGYQQGNAAGYAQGYQQGNKTGYNLGYGKGKTDGYSNGYSANSNGGYSQGQTDALGAILDWQMNTCTMFYNNYYQIKFWRAYDNSIKYSCLVQ